jgi:hypothetical protein
VVVGLLRMQRWEDQLQKDVDLLSTYLSHLQTDRNLDIIIGRYEAIKKRIKSLKESYVIEMQLIRDRNERREYEVKLQLISKRIQENSEKIDKMIQIRQNKSLLMTTSYDLQQQPLEDQVLSRAKSLQNETKSSIARSKDLVDHSSFVAASTLETLHEQREQTMAIGSEVREIGSKMERAQTLVTEYIHFIASDRIFQFLTMLNVTLVMVIILVYFLKNQ